MILVLAHGWGFDAGFWGPLRRCLPEFESVAIDLGFTGRPFIPTVPAGRLVAVGHSLGLPWLLRQSWPFARVVAINGFARFTKTPEYPHGTHRRVLERMRARLLEEPEAVYREFLRRCGICNAAAEALDVQALATGLDWLAEWQVRTDLPLLALAGGCDAVVAEAASRDSFPETCLRFQPEAGHLLPLTHPEWCADHIRAWLTAP